MLKNKKKIFTFLFLYQIILILPCVAKHLQLESEYQKQWCDKKGGQLEYVLKNGGRVDCLTDKLAVEVDFAPKWHECIGQALYYAAQTNRTPACVLIMENPQKDIRYVYKLRHAVYNKKNIKNFKTFTIKPVYTFVEEEI